MVKILWEIPWKGMRNALFYGQNAGNTMRNAIFYFISHSVMSLIYKILLCALWEHEKWKIVSSSGFWTWFFEFSSRISLGPDS